MYRLKAKIDWNWQPMENVESMFELKSQDAM